MLWTHMHILSVELGLLVVQPWLYCLAFHLSCMHCIVLHVMCRWYMQRITPWALLGYFAGLGTYVAMHSISLS